MRSRAELAAGVLRLSSSVDPNFGPKVAAKIEMGLVSTATKRAKIAAPIILLAIYFHLPLRSHLSQLQDSLETLLGDLIKTSQAINITDDLNQQQQKQSENFAWSAEFGLWTLSGEESATADKADRGSCIWPEDCQPGDDRIIDQLQLSGQLDHKIFKILPPDRGFPLGQRLFLDQSCRVNRCEITYDHQEADALIFQNADVTDPAVVAARQAHQVWIAYLLESPPNTFDARFERLHRAKQPFNWTASYRADSDIVTPYAKFVPHRNQLQNYHDLKRSKPTPSPPLRKPSISEPKVAWFASNCNAANRRLEYARELAKHVQVDIYGKCGDLTCDKRNQSGCHELIDLNYKFYLAFENSNCQEYVTEKLFWNALGHNELHRRVIPIVMGAPRADYERLAPAKSFIHVDDFKQPRELAIYLRYLNEEEAAFSEYFHWKRMGRFVDTKFMCRVCALLHESHLRIPHAIRSHESIRHWWLFKSNATSPAESSACESQL